MKFEVLRKAHDVLPMARDRLEVVNTEGMDVIRKGLNSFSLKCSLHVRLGMQVWSFEGPTEGRGMHCSMQEQLLSGCREANEIMRLILESCLVYVLRSAIAIITDAEGLARFVELVHSQCLWARG